MVVFGAAVSSAGEPSATLRQRLRVALRLAREDPEAVVVVSGGVVRGRPAEAPMMARWLVRQGLAEERILLEAASRSTWENAEQVAPMLRRMGARRVSAVTQRFHGRRAVAALRLALRRAGGDPTIVELSPAADPRGRFSGALALLPELIKSLNDATLRRLRRRMRRG